VSPRRNAYQDVLSPMEEKRPSSSAVRVVGLFLACLAAMPAALGQSATTKSSLSQLDQLSSSVQALAARVSPSVVQVLVAGYEPRKEGGGRMAEVSRNEVSGRE